jgi:hypothetical protein
MVKIKILFFFQIAKWVNWRFKNIFFFQLTHHFDFLNNHKANNSIAISLGDWSRHTGMCVSGHPIVYDPWTTTHHSIGKYLDLVDLPGAIWVLYISGQRMWDMKVMSPSDPDNMHSLCWWWSRRAVIGWHLTWGNRHPGISMEYIRIKAYPSDVHLINHHLWINIHLNPGNTNHSDYEVIHHFVAYNSLFSKYMKSHYMISMQ